MGYEKNTRTLIATFSDYSTACNAARELNQIGVPQEAVYIDSNKKTAGAGSAGFSQSEEPRSGFAEWWHSLFGSDREQDVRQQYEGALAEGRTVVRAVVVEELTNSSTDILNRHGAQEIETRSESAGKTYAGSGSSSSGATQGGVRIYDQGSLHPAEPRSAATIRSTTTRRSSDAVPFGFGFTPGSGTLAGEATAGSGIQDFSFQNLTEQDRDIADYRRHFEQNYGDRKDFDSMLSAYQHGARSATDERFRKMSWDEAEDALRTEYENQGALSPWNDARPAVRYGWDRMAGKRGD